MTRKWLIIALAAIACLLLAVLAALLFGSPKRPEAPTPSPSLLPETAVRQTLASDLKFTVEQPAVTPDGKLLFSTYRGTAIATSAADGQDFRLLTPQRFKYIQSIAWSPDGARAVVQDADGSTYLFVTADQSLRELSKNVDHVSWAPDNIRFASTYEGRAQVFDLASNRFEALPAEAAGDGFEWSPDGKKLAIYDAPGQGEPTAQGSLRVYDLSAKAVSQPVLAKVFAATWNQDGTRVFAAYMDNDNARTAWVAPGSEPSLLPEPADITSASIRSGALLVTGPRRASGDYVGRRGSATDSLWEIRPGETARELTRLDKQAVTSRVVGTTLIVVTNTRIYRIELGNG